MDGRRSQAGPLKFLNTKVGQLVCLRITAPLVSIEGSARLRAGLESRGRAAGDNPCSKAPSSL